MPGVRKSPASSNLAILTVKAPDTFRQLRDKIKGVFRRKKKIAPVDPNALIVDAPVDTTAAVSGAVPAQDGAGPAEPAPVAGTQTGLSFSCCMSLSVCLLANRSISRESTEPSADFESYTFPS